MLWCDIEVVICLIVSDCFFMLCVLLMIVICVLFLFMIVCLGMDFGVSIFLGMLRML